jgi:hypothetical protein
MQTFVDQKPFEISTFRSFFESYLVAGIGAAIALSALASLPPHISTAQTPPVGAPMTAVAYSHDPLVIFAR